MLLLKSITLLLKRKVLYFCSKEKYYTFAQKYYTFAKNVLYFCSKVLYFCSKVLYFFFQRTDEESVERKASRKEREGRARKGAKTKTTGGLGKHYGTSRLEQHPYSRGKRESVPQARLPTRQA